MSKIKKEKIDFILKNYGVDWKLGDVECYQALLKELTDVK